jgi:hypothetical protein
LKWLDCHLSGFANVSPMCIFTPMCNIHVSIFLMWSVGPIYLTWSVGPIRHTLKFCQTNLTRGSHASVRPDTRVPRAWLTWLVGPATSPDGQVPQPALARPTTRCCKINKRAGRGGRTLDLESRHGADPLTTGLEHTLW